VDGSSGAAQTAEAACWKELAEALNSNPQPSEARKSFQAFVFEPSYLIRQPKDLIPNWRKMWPFLGKVWQDATIGFPSLKSHQLFKLGPLAAIMKIAGS
jgi:hypothetical protein